MEWKLYKEEFESKADLKVEWLLSEFNKIKSGRPNPKIFDHILVNAYDSKMKIVEIANLQVVDGRQILIKPYDKTLLKEINAAILKENMGFSPQVDADSLRIIFPSPTEESRKQSLKKVKEYVEQAKIGIRNVRKDIQGKIRNDKELREDELKSYEEDLDKITKHWNSIIDNEYTKKEKEMMTI